MEEKNELNDIILNKANSNGGNKKLLLAVAMLALILIIVVVIMNSLKSENTQNLPQAVLPPEPIAKQNEVADKDPLFEPVEVIEENVAANDDLTQIAQKLKEESNTPDDQIVEEDVVVVEPKALTPPAAPKPAASPEPVKTVQKTEPKPVVQTPASKPVAQKPTSNSISRGAYYIQVGSFSRLEPSKTFLNNIESNGYTYTYHTVKRNGQDINKVLIGPFNSESEGRQALIKIRKTIESGAFMLRM